MDKNNTTREEEEPVTKKEVFIILIAVVTMGLFSITIIVSFIVKLKLKRDPLPLHNEDGEDWLDMDINEEDEEGDGEEILFLNPVACRTRSQKSAV
jgi:flagellar basal body-associated protein FliL